jgi:signal transduction histidine kinase/ligand-binding sensor domain-containing protein
MQDGYFQGAPNAIAQTTDGYIWVGTETGLLRFDGVRFVTWSAPGGKGLPATAITALLAARDGSLWIGTEAGIAHWTGDNLINYPSEPGRVNSIVEDRSRTVWFTHIVTPESAGPVCQVRAENLNCVTKPQQAMAQMGAAGLAEDADGSVWIGAGMQLLRWNSGVSSAWDLSPATAKLGGISSIVLTASNELWAGIDVSGPGLGLQRFSAGKWAPLRTPGFDSSELAVTALHLDHEHALWIGTSAQGVYRFCGTTVDHFRIEDGLSGNFVFQLLEDREGTLWAVTATGIDSFRDTRITTFSVREGFHTGEVDSVLAAGDGTVWAGGTDSLEHIEDGHITSIQSGKGLPGHQVTSLLEDRTGDLWVGIDFGLSRYRHGQFQNVKPLEGHPIGVVYGLTEDTHGNIWAATNATANGLLRIQGLKVEEEISAPQISRIRRLAANPDGGIWMGLVNGDLALLRNEKLTTFPFRRGSNPSVDTYVNQLLVLPDGKVLAATGSGLVGVSQGERHTLNTGNGLPCNRIHALALDQHDNLWLYTKCGLAEIDRAHLQLWWESPGIAVPSRVLDMFDGTQPGLAPFAAAARTPDGRLWFANGLALQTVNPAQLAPNPLAPPVHIEGIEADRVPLPPMQNMVLKPNTRDLQINYTALSFVVPNKVRFRYRLEGHDEQWQEPGTRRAAYYTDLRPGRYLFRVIACNNDGVWNEVGDRLSFTLEPAWYQSGWFRALGILGVILLLWTVYNIRMRQVASVLAARFNERLSERTRLARELHDTLLQTIEASKLIADAALGQPPALVNARNTLARVADWLGVAIHEGRAALNSIRTSTQHNDLAEIFRTMAQDPVTDPTAMKVVISSVGVIKELHPFVRDEIQLVGTEAIRNARRHSKGSCINIELIYATDLILRISDNGQGIRAGVLESGQAGHFGIQGMRERAAGIGGTLNVATSPESGTRVTLTIPGKVVFQSGWGGDP